MSSLDLKKFDMNMISDDKVVVLIGKRETGKSFLVKDLLYYHKNVPVGTVISGTEGANAFYSKIMPSIFIHGEYKPEIISNVLKRQKKVVSSINKEVEETGNSNIDPRAFLILDDCLYDKSWVNNKNIRSLFMNGRHYKIMFLITMQYALGIPPNLRTNIDFVFLLRENYMSNRKRLYEQYAGMFPSFDFFCQVMDQCTEDFECLVINNNAKSNKLEDQVFWYKADPHDDFQIGASEFWQYHSQNYNPNFDNDENEISLSEIRAKKGPIINVKKQY
uniref:Uncharacterized protein n=1 Tax=viral metagenome TaxID=1070528 RepID=A0A6C0IYG0_9ZZZZ